MNVYLAGPMRGYPELNFPAFMAAANRLREIGHTVFNPAEQDIEKGFVGKAFDEIKRDCILLDLTYIVKEAEAIALLPGWRDSKGVAAEIATADFLGLPVWELSEGFYTALKDLHARVEQV